jgi:SAM-dependent methyltransferase
LSRQVDDRQLRINAVWADLTTYRFPESAYDVVVNVKYLERSIARQLARSLRPGGLLLFESFTRTASGSGRPMNPRVTLEPGELRDAFPELDVVDYREEAAAREGAQHKRDVARLVARRPPGK